MLNRSFTPFPILITERLTLRQPVISDEQEIFTLRSDSEINKYLDRQVSNTIEDAFNTIKVQKIEAFLHRDNQSSIKLLDKFSFRNSNEPDKTNPELICYHLTNSINNLE